MIRAKGEGSINSLVMILIGVCVIPVELIMDNILAGMRRLGPLQCDCGLADISGPEIARLWWHTWTRSNIQRHMTSTSTSTSTNREGNETRMAHVRTRIFGFWFSVSVGLVIMKRKLRKLNKIQTNQCGIYLYMPISDIMQILSPHTHIRTCTRRKTNGRRHTELIELHAPQTDLCIYRIYFCLYRHNESSVRIRDHIPLV